MDFQYYFSMDRVQLVFLHETDPLNASLLHLSYLKKMDLYGFSI